VGKTESPKPPQPRTPVETPQQKLERLIREQGIKPYDPEHMAKLWPEEFDPDAFNKWLAEDRAARRAMAEKQG
jgi:hypothetical protein